MNATPITPGEIAARKAALLPDSVIEAFNDLIARKWTGREARIDQADVVMEILAHDPGLSRDLITSRHLLDIEPVFEAAGWSVVYDQPTAYGGDTYPPAFVFTRRSSMAKGVAACLAALMTEPA